jgi:hypothetical protein
VASYGESGSDAAHTGARDENVTGDLLDGFIDGCADYGSSRVAEHRDVLNVNDGVLRSGRYRGQE